MERNGILDEEVRRRRCRYFSEDFKKKRVKELEKNLVRVSDICKTYGVSHVSVYRWLYTYSAMAKRQVRQVVEAKSDTRRIQMLEARIKELEQNVGQKQIMIEFLNKMIDIAEEKLSVDIKKNSGLQPYSGSGNSGVNTLSR